MNRASVPIGTGSTSWRSFARLRRRIDRSTSASHHSWPLPPGRNSPATSRPVRGEPLQRRGHDGHAEPQPRGDLGRLERAVGAGVAADQVAERIGDRLGEHLGHADRQRRAERVAQPAGVLDGDVALLAGDAHDQRPPGVDQLGQPLLRTPRVRAASAAVRSPTPRSRSAAPSTSRGCRCGRQPLQLRLDLAQRLARRAARAARSGRAARRAGRCPAPAPAPGARPAGRRPRRGTGRRSRTAATGRTARRLSVCTSTTRTRRERTSRISSTSPGTS